MKRLHTTYFIILWLFMSLSVSCRQDTEAEPPPGTDDGEELLLSLNVSTGFSQTRAMTDESENKIEEIDVLVFRDGQFLYRAEAVPNSIVDIGSGQEQFRRKEFTVSLISSEYANNSLLILANAHQSVLDAENAGLLKGGRDKIAHDIEFGITGQDRRWPAGLDNGSTATRPIPMSGESGPVKINKDLEQVFRSNPVPMYRSLARVDVGVSSRVTNFELTELYIHRYNMRGCVAIGKDADWAEHPYTGEMRVRNVTLPADPATQPAIDSDDKNNGLYYLGYNLGMNSPVASIYLLESERADMDDYGNATCLIVGGRYDGGAVTYYRIDFEIIWLIEDEDPEGGPGGSTTIIIEAGELGYVGAPRVFARILRNHIYDITITKVNGPGKPTKEEARGYLDTFGMELSLKVAPWGNTKIDIGLEY